MPHNRGIKGVPPHHTPSPYSTIMCTYRVESKRIGPEIVHGFPGEHGHLSLLGSHDHTVDTSRAALTNGPSGPERRQEGKDYHLTRKLSMGEDIEKEYTIIT